MKRQVQFPSHLLLVFSLSFILFGGVPSAFASAPLVRFKTGFSSLAVNAGELGKMDLRPTVTLQPSILWEVPEFSARIGASFLQEIGGAYGATPISGLGFTGYYHIFGISTTYNTDQEGTVVQKSRAGPFLAGSFTPVNFNLNHLAEGGVEKNLFFSAYLFDLSTGFGYDYPLSQNMILSAEFMLRNGSGATTAGSNVNYSGYTFFLSIATSYY